MGQQIQTNLKVNMSATFEHVNLNDVNPDNESVEQGRYDLRVGKVELKTYTSKKNPGETGEYINASFVIVNDPKFSGRRVFASFFPGNGTNKQFRRLMDATGVQPTGVFTCVQDMVDYLDSIRVAGATINAPVGPVQEKQKDGSMAPATRINFWEVSA